MLLYFILDTSTSLVLWLIKYLGLGIYYSISYLFLNRELTDTEKKDKKTLEMLIEQKADIKIIKEYIETLEENRNKTKKD